MKNSKLLTLLIALVLAIAGCGGQSAEEQVLEQLLEGGENGISDIDIDTDTGEINISIEGEDGGDVSISGSGEDDDFSMVIEGEDGEVMTFGSGQIPDLNLPVPDGGEVLMSMDSSEGATVALIYPGASYDQLVAFYQDQVPSDATKNELTSKEDGETIRHTSWFGSDFMVSIDDCEGPDTNEMDSVCVSINEFGG